jgi:hypothetical protein
VPAGPLGIAPLASVGDVAGALWSACVSHPALLGAAGLSAAAAAVLPWAHRRSPFGVPLVGFTLVAASVAAGAGIAGTFVAMVVWAIATAASATSRIARLADSTV